MKGRCRSGGSKRDGFSWKSLGKVFEGVRGVVWVMISFGDIRGKCVFVL